MSFNKVFLFVTCFIMLCSSNSDDVYVIKTNGSKIVGRKMFSIFEDKPYTAFWKIPYAVPPIGKLRFKVYIILIFILYIYLSVKHNNF